MCMGSRPKMPVDNSAQIARQAEEQRQARIAEGTSAIDSAFSGYNDDFYNNYQNDYIGYYTPQLEDQYADARKRLTLQLAKTGNLTSSTGADQFGDLKERYNTQNTMITNQAMDAANALRGNVDARKSQLYADNRSSADPGNAASAAATAAQALQPGMPSSPLANAFADLFSNAGNAAVIGANSRPYQNTGVQNYGAGGTKSVKIVN